MYEDYRIIIVMSGGARNTQRHVYNIATAIKDDNNNKFIEPKDMVHAKILLTMDTRRQKK